MAEGGAVMKIQLPHERTKYRDHEMNSWVRIVANDGSTVGYTPDEVTARKFAASDDLLEAANLIMESLQVANGAPYATEKERIAIETIANAIAKAEGKVS